MNRWKADRIMDRLDLMIEHAINGEAIETEFDETKMSALETKLAQYLKLNQTSKQELKEEKQRIHELISDISHQTKTPIANMLLYSQLLEEQGADLNDVQKECVEALARQAKKLDFLIASLVKTSRLEAGIVSVAPKVQPISLLVKQTLEQIHPLAKQKEIGLILEESDMDSILVNYDLKWTTEALYNILDNAVKYSDAGTEIKVTVIPYQLFCRIDISDRGIGMMESDTARIFTRFYRAEEVREREGVGLGLSLAREIISKENGYIRVASTPGKGSVFSVFLPLAE